MNGQVNIIEWTGGDAPTKTCVLRTDVTQGPKSMRFAAIWEPGYCGCPDCHLIVGWGATEAEAIADYWEQWEEKYGN